MGAYKLPQHPALVAGTVPVQVALSSSWVI